MRGSRLRYDKEMRYYHLMSRVAGEPGGYSFGDTEKEKRIQLATDLSRFYSLDLLPVVVLGNHWHIVCSAPAEAPGKEEVIANWRACKGTLPVEPNWDDGRIGTGFRCTPVQTIQEWHASVRPVGRIGTGFRCTPVQTIQEWHASVRPVSVLRSPSVGSSGSSARRMERCVGLGIGTTR